MSEPSVCRTTYPRARKEHRCVECGYRIPVGQKYAKTWGVWEGEHGTFKAHLWCHRFSQRFVTHQMRYYDIYPEDSAAIGDISFAVRENSDDVEWHNRWRRISSWTRDRYGSLRSEGEPSGEG